jgi:hypothetical protein
MKASLILIGVAIFACPAAYVWLCDTMRCARIARPPIVPFFLVFGTVGGWVLAAALSPSGLAATSLIFLATAAPLALVASSVYLIRRPERSIYHRVAIWFGFGYVGLLILAVSLIAAFSPR